MKTKPNVWVVGIAVWIGFFLLYWAGREPAAALTFVKSMAAVGAFAGVVAIFAARSRRKERERMTTEIGGVATALCTVVSKTFLVQACSQCGETSMRLLSVSPEGRSVHYACVHCEKKQWAPAGTPAAAEVLRSWELLAVASSRFAARWGKTHTLRMNLNFTTAAAPLPYEQTSREPIPAAVRTEVWRRDQGKCVECGSNQNLQFDHIISVAHGGATSAQNLQLLCRQHNLAKHATI